MSIYQDIYFNTSHVTVYQFSEISITTSYEFQYISCYCLSKKCRMKKSIICNFNTSHVTVYLSGFILPFASVKFQYISCYCLSHYCEILSIFVITFQYISCYCLSCILSEQLCFNLISIHLMLLFIRDIQTHFMLRTQHFNTSHVTVYLFDIQ